MPRQTRARLGSTPCPLTTRPWDGTCPPTSPPVNTAVDMSHIGVDITNNKTLRKCHDRTLATKKCDKSCLSGGWSIGR